MHEFRGERMLEVLGVRRKAIDYVKESDLGSHNVKGATVSFNSLVHEI